MGLGMFNCLSIAINFHVFRNSQLCFVFKFESVFGITSLLGI